MAILVKMMHAVVIEAIVNYFIELFVYVLIVKVPLQGLLPILVFGLIQINFFVDLPFFRSFLDFLFFLIFFLFLYLLLAFVIVLAPFIIQESEECVRSLMPLFDIFEFQDHPIFVAGYLKIMASFFYVFKFEIQFI